MDKKTIRGILLIVTYCIILIVAILKTDVLISTFTKGIHVLVPILIGIAIAFVLNRPYNFFIKKYELIIKNKKMNRVIRPLALATVYILFIGIITGILTFIIPQISDSIKLLYTNMGDYSRNLEAIILRLTNYLKINNVDLSSIDAAIQKLPELVADFVTGFMPRVFNFTTSFLSSLINIIIGFVLSLYLLADKERIKKQLSSIILAYLSVSFAKKIMKVTRITSETFTRFVSGQFLEACILGILCFIGMLVFGFEYPILISVMIGITSLIPIAGAIIGLIPALFILMMIDPMQAVWFLVFIILLQQLEGNVIYPRVVGNSIGLPALWVLLAIIIGGGLFGVLGMLLGVPTLSVIYQLVKEDVNIRNTTKTYKTL